MLLVMAGAYISDAREFVVAFVNAVTVPTELNSDIIARKGRESIFGVLEQVFPQASAGYI